MTELNFTEQMPKSDNKFQSDNKKYHTNSCLSKVLKNKIE